MEESKEETKTKTTNSKKARTHIPVEGICVLAFLEFVVFVFISSLDSSMSMFAFDFT